MAKQLPVHEQFYSFQGEGCHAGRAAYFIRLFGCPVHCPWCDSAGTWHPDYVPESIDRVLANDLLASVQKTAAEFVVITGGEPAIHDLSELTAVLRRAGYPVHLETSGAFELKGVFDWVTLSPKRWKLPLPENLKRADEFKLIVDELGAIEEYARLPGVLRSVPVWLHPEWSQQRNQAILSAITEWVKAHGAPFRAGWQMHKQYAADLDDPRSAPAAPLGGDPERGY
ncbi:7-carboxy-7-deazaguanine synthase QueE [Coraliomargarita akajimensis]|uniref:7-carboxy-7-deazaguanine synthase n=1 Tax=Coraliomargarita akajimensis (strain DSM 45221 / IAM 15411 / JCM 23193 / KCTC 12865 / 04OKA010-24) TaxID=583355 RepID=D5EK67_CORAD|nr:7-carboxy-7-deazaguanine synthase QueE [Coraliomargarita akajimensis]ADE54816.1 Radical SAM domain protein [Coraliomargarita akajimensis DSM 45221]